MIVRADPELSITLTLACDGGRGREACDAVLPMTVRTAREIGAEARRAGWSISNGSRSQPSAHNCPAHRMKRATRARVDRGVHTL